MYPGSRYTRGVTALEMIVVIGITILLASLVLVSVGTVRSNSRDGQRVAEVKLVRLALEEYRNVCGEYPASLNLTENNGCSGATTLGSFLADTDYNAERFRYAALYNDADSNERCIHYHVSVVLETDRRSELSSDDDYNSGTGADDYEVCDSGVESGTQYSESFSGSDTAPVGANLDYTTIPYTP